MNTIIGLDELIANMRAFPEKLENKVIKKAVRSGAVIVRDKARGYVATDTGNLKKSITIISEKAKPGTIKFSIKPIKRKAKSARDPFYGKFVELGTSKMPARPYMRPAYDEAGDDVIERVIDTINKNIREATV